MSVLTANNALCGAKDLCSDLLRAATQGDMQVLDSCQQRAVMILSVAGFLVVHTLLAIARYSTAEIMRTALSLCVLKFSDRRRASSAVILLGSVFSLSKMTSSWSWN